MLTPSQTIVSDIVRLGNTTIGDKTIPDLQAFLDKVLNYADSLAARGTTVDELADSRNTP